MRGQFRRMSGKLTQLSLPPAIAAIRSLITRQRSGETVVASNACVVARLQQQLTALRWFGSRIYLRPLIRPPPLREKPPLEWPPVLVGRTSMLLQFLVSKER